MQRANNFDLIRLYFACVVVLKHCYDLSLQPGLNWIPRVANSRIAVEGFFAISGYLIVGSYERRSSLRSYFTKRAVRILPAYWETLVFCLGFGVIASALPAMSFIESKATWKYFLADLSFANFLQPSLPGLFMNSAGGTAVNGALWTIKIELMFYLLVPAIAALCRRFGKWRTLLPLFFLSILYRAGCEHWHQDALAKQVPGQFCFFAVGILIYYSSIFFLTHSKLMWAVAAGASASYLALGGVALEATAVGLTVLCFALLFPPVKGPTKYGDFSYGAYVFHWPVIQIIVAAGLFHTHPQLAVAVVFASVAILAVASWHLIESPSLRIGHRPPSAFNHTVLSQEPLPTHSLQ